MRHRPAAPCSPITAWWWPSSTRRGGGRPGPPTSTSPPSSIRSTSSASTRASSCDRRAGRRPLAQRRRRARRQLGHRGGAAAFAGLCDRAAEHGLLVHLEWLAWSKIPDLATAWRSSAWPIGPTGVSTSTCGTVPDGDHAGSTWCRARPGCSACRSTTVRSMAEDDLVEATLHDRSLPGEGEFDLVGYLGALADRRRTAPIGVEVFSRRAPPVRARRGGEGGRRHEAASLEQVDEGASVRGGSATSAGGSGRRRRDRVRLCDTTCGPCGRPASRWWPWSGRDPVKTAAAGPDVRRPVGPRLRDRGAATARRGTPSPSPPRHTPMPPSGPRGDRRRQARPLREALRRRQRPRRRGCWPRPSGRASCTCWARSSVGTPARPPCPGRRRRHRRPSHGWPHGSCTCPVLAAADAEVPDWWADAGSSGGWLAAHGSQLIDQIRATLGEFEGVSASLVHVVDRPMSCRRRLRRALPDGQRLRRGACRAQRPDHGVLVETRVTGSSATAWIEGVGAPSSWQRPVASGPCRRSRSWPTWPHRRCPRVR